MQARAARALGETGTEPALVPASLLHLKSAPILERTAELPAAPVPLAALPGTLAEVPADFWTLTAMVLLVLAMLASMFIWKGPRSTSHHGHA